MSLLKSILRLAFAGGVFEVLPNCNINVHIKQIFKLFRDPFFFFAVHIFDDDIINEI